MKAKEKNKLAAGKLVIALLAVVGVIIVIWFAWIRPEEEPIDSFEECRAAGYPIMESYPPMCAVPGGKTYTAPQGSY